jgi:hypothetical protein
VANHPNRGRSPSAARNPRPTEVVAARERVQKALDIGITEAQTWCARQVHTTIRSWQQWERDERRMHPAFWELFERKAKEK